MAEYTKAATSDSPAHIIYLLDASRTMRTTLDGQSRASWLEVALENALEKMLDRSYSGATYDPRYKIAVITYSNIVDDSLTKGGFIDVQEFYDEGIPQFSPDGETNTAGAFERAHQLLDNLLKDSDVQERCPAPLVCHVTDGEWNIGGDPKPIVDKIKLMSNDDGAILVQNLFISDRLLNTPINDVKGWPGFMPSDVSTAFKNDYAQDLFNMSSDLPVSYAGVLRENGFNLKADSKMMYPGQSSDLIKLAFVASTSTPFR